MEYTENEKILIDFIKSLQLCVSDDMDRDEVIFKVNQSHVIQSHVIQSSCNSDALLNEAKRKKKEHEERLEDKAVFMHDESLRPWELKQKDAKCANRGWFFCKLKNGLHKVDRVDKTADTFEDWIYFNGKEWDINDYRDLGFYVLDVIKAEGRK